MLAASISLWKGTGYYRKFAGPYQKMEGIKMKEILDKVLREMEVLREDFRNRKDPPDYVIRLCENIVARHAGYKDRAE